MTNRYDEVRSRSVDDPEGFWAEAAEEIHWYKKWHKVLDDSNKPLYRWFVGGEVNTCYNAVDRHTANGRGEQVALIYDSPVTDMIKTFTFYALREEITIASVCSLRSLPHGKESRRQSNCRRKASIAI